MGFNSNSAYGFSGSGGSGGGGGTPVDFFSVTKAAADALIAADGLVAGSFYKITDRGDLGILLQAITVDSFSSQGIRYMLCPSFYGVGASGGHTWIGIWNIAKSVNAGDLAIRGGLVWTNTSGNIGTAAGQTGLSGADWTVVAKASFAAGEYTPISFGIMYDYTNDWIGRQWDTSGNIFGIDFYQEQNIYGNGFNAVDLSDWNYETSSFSFSNNTCLGIYNNAIGTGGAGNNIYNNSNSGFIYGNANDGEISSNSCAGPIFDNTSSVTGITSNSCSGPIVGNSNAGAIDRNSNNAGITFNSNTGDVSVNSNLGSISNNTSQGAIVFNSNTSNIISNTNTGVISNNSNAGIISSNANQGAIDNNSNNGDILNSSSNTVNISANKNNGSILGNDSFGNISNNANNGSISGNGSNMDGINNNVNNGAIDGNQGLSGGLAIEFNTNNGSITGINWNASITDPVVDKAS